MNLQTLKHETEQEIEQQKNLRECVRGKAYNQMCLQIEITEAKFSTINEIIELVKELKKKYDSDYEILDEFVQELLGDKDE